MIGIFLLHVLFFSAFPLFFTLLPKPQRQVHFYIYLSLVLLVGGFLGNAYSLELADGIVISGGNICYAAFMMSAVLFVLVERDIFILRRLVWLVILVDLFKIVFSLVATAAFETDGILNPHETPVELFRQSTPLIILGGMLIVLEFLTLFFVFERLKRFRLNPSVTGVIYIASFVTVLCVDGVVFPLIAFGVSPEIVAIVFGGLDGKFIAAVCFSLPLLVYMILAPKDFAEYLEADVFNLKLLITPSSALARELEEKEKQLEQAEVVFSNSNEGLAVLDSAGTLLRVNNAFKNMLFGDDDPTGKNAAGPGQQFRRGNQAFDLAALLPSAWRGEVQFGSDYNSQGILSVSPVTADRTGKQTFVCSLTDITEQKNAQQSLDYLAMHDPLTALANRRSLEKQLKELSACDSALVILDLYGFKDINDSYGPQVADEILQLVANRLLSVKETAELAPTDVFRIGGDKFALLFSSADIDAIKQTVDKAKASIEVSIELPTGIEIFTSATSGASHNQNGAENDLLQEAISALHQAKRTNRNSVDFYEERFTLDARRRQNISLSLKKALENGNLEVFFQPKIDLESNQITGAEALVRWTDTNLGMVSPTEFIPVAEETGLINALGYFVLEEACKAGRKMSEELKRPIQMSVNVSAHQLKSARFGTNVETVLNDTGFPPDLLELELTESAYLEKGDEVLALFSRLKEMGISIAIDDFGTGYSSLSALKALPWDTLKIDRSFVASIPQNKGMGELTAGIIKIAKSMSLTIVAEGVETDEQLSFLKNEGSDLYQGFLCSPAVPLSEFLMLEQKRVS